MVLVFVNILRHVHKENFGLQNSDVTDVTSKKNKFMGVLNVTSEQL